MSMAVNHFHLQPEELAEIRKPFPGQGGAQDFMARLNRLIKDDGRGNLTDDDVGRIWRYAAHANGQGGYQGRLRRAFRRSLMAPFA